MEIVSKFWGKCKTCNGKISKGQLIEWDREKGPRHTKCDAGPQPRQQQPKPYPKQYQTRRRTPNQAFTTQLRTPNYERRSAAARPGSPAPARLARTCSYSMNYAGTMTR